MQTSIINSIVELAHEMLSHKIAEHDINVHVCRLSGNMWSVQRIKEVLTWGVWSTVHSTSLNSSFVGFSLAKEKDEEYVLAQSLKLISHGTNKGN